MTVLDAYAIIAYFRAEPSSAEVARLLREPTWLTAVNAAEVCDQMVRVFGGDPDGIEADLALLGHAGMALVPVSPEMAIEAGRIRARRYHREHAAVSLADCIAAAAAIAGQQPLATADPALANVVRAEGGDIHPLPDSAGRRP
jgi:PIN domain nuclease of toxin-antitoxin system